MKKLWSVLLLTLVSMGILLGWSVFRNYIPALPPATIDASRYVFSYSPQEIRLKSRNRNWVLLATSTFDADGILENETIFRFDEDGQAFFMNGEIRAEGTEAGYGSSYYDDDLTHFLEAWDIQEEQFDGFGRMLFREAFQPHCSEGTHIFERAGYIYCPGVPTSNAMESLSAFTRTMGICFDTPEDSILEIRDPESEKRTGWRLEDTSYEIFVFDRYGNAVRLWIESDGCCFLENADGYLKTVIQNTAFGYMVHQVDPSGRPLWYAWYDKRDGKLIRYTIWEYGELEQEKSA